MGETPVGETEIVVTEDIKAEGYFDIFARYFRFFLMIRSVNAA
jgi:hypothetical protein